MILLLNCISDYFMRLKFSSGLSVSQDFANLSVLFIWYPEKPCIMYFFSSEKNGQLYLQD